MKGIKLDDELAATLTAASRAQKEGRLDEAVWALLDLERGLEELRQRHRRLIHRIEDLRERAGDNVPDGLDEFESELAAKAFSKADQLQPFEAKLNAIDVDE